MKILIIGGTGILSKAVVDECVEKGYEVTMLNRGRRKLFISERVELIKCDVHDAETVKSKITGRYFDTVIDFLCFNKKDIEYSVGLFGDYAKQYVFISSAQAYNTSVRGTLTEESELGQPLWGYSTNKVEAEKILKELCEQKGLQYTIIRPGVNYDNKRIPYGMYPPMGLHWAMCSRILVGKPIITWNNGENRLNLTRAEDFAKGAVALLGVEKAYGEAFNVVGDYVYSWKEVLDTLGKLLGKEVKTIDIPVDYYAKELSNEEDRQMLLGGRAQDLVCSNKKLKEISPAFKSTYNLEEGMKLTLDFYKEHHYLGGFDYRYDGECDRIIKKYEKSKGLKSSKLGFIKYSHDTTLKDRVKYFAAYYRNSFLVKMAIKIINLLQK